MINKITTAKIYKFKSITFEFHAYCGPLFLRRKDWEPKPQQFRPMRDYAALAQWEKLSKDEREQYRENSTGFYRSDASILAYPEAWAANVG